MQYLHNKKLSHEVLHSTRPEYNDWSVTSAFYSALHLINAHCMDCKIPIPKTHTTRTKTVRNNLSQIRDAYENLLDLSKHARYKKIHSKMTDLDVQRAHEYLRKIEEQIPHPS